MPPSRPVPRRKTTRTLVAAALMAVAALVAATGANAAVVARPLCPPPPAEHARCESEILIDTATGGPAHPAGLTGTAAPQTGSPAWLQWAYDLEGLSAAGPSATDTIAVVDPFGDSAAESDLGMYRSTFGLPACTTQNGCFKKVDQTGGTNYPPDASGANASWITETSLDLDMVSAICPGCHILLAEANTNGDSDLAAAEVTAATTASPFDPEQITNSWSWTGDTTHNSAFDPSNIAVVAATGDSGYDTFGVPAQLPSVTAVGGTSLPAANAIADCTASASAAAACARGFSETAWSGTASGCATGNAKPSWQKDSGCASRTVADLAADSDIATGAIAYDSTVDDGWFVAGGTSVASPIVAAYYALVGGGAGNGGAAWAYTNRSALNDITAGSERNCVTPPTQTYLCTAQTGYDGPTGEGSISGDVVAGAPQAAGSLAQAVTDTTATLDGGVYANQLDTQVQWQYGPTNAYGQTTPVLDAGSALGVAPVSANLTGLSPDTTYHFRLVAMNRSGTSYGYDATFSTASPPASTQTLSTSATVTASTVTVTASPPPTVSSTQTTTTASAPLTTRTTTTSSQTARSASIAALQVLVGPFAAHRGRRVRVRVSCSRRCAGRIALRVDGQVIGRAHIALRDKQFTGVASLPLDATGRRLLRHRGRLRAVVVLALNGHLMRATVVVG